MDQKYLIFKKENGIATISLNRPSVLNSLNREMAEELIEALQRISGDREVRVVLLSGEGRAFCAGQDLAELTKDGQIIPQDLSLIVKERYNPIIRAIRTIEKPFVCAVRGIAAGAGANLALACDIVIAGKSAAFVQPFAQIGLVPDSGGTFVLPRLIGLARATALTFLGDKIGADEAVAMGMIYKAVEDAELDHVCAALVQKLATGATRSIGLTKRALNRSLGNNLETQLEVERELQGAAGESRDYAEGVAAFLGKRKPNFCGA